MAITVSVRRFVCVRITGKLSRLRERRHASDRKGRPAPKAVKQWGQAVLHSEKRQKEGSTILYCFLFVGADNRT